MRIPAVLTLVVLAAACGGGSSDNGTTQPSPTALSVGGDYTTAVALTENSCGAVTVLPLATRVEHAAGATSMRLTHGATYDCTVTAAGAFTCTPRTFDVSGRQETVTIAGQFRTTGFDATASVAVQPTACAYAVRWTGTKQGPANVIP
jgi:hypothetical protein